MMLSGEDGVIERKNIEAVKGAMVVRIVIVRVDVAVTSKVHTEESLSVRVAIVCSGVGRLRDALEGDETILYCGSGVKEAFDKAAMRGLRTLWSDTVAL